MLNIVACQCFQKEVDFSWLKRFHQKFAAKIVFGNIIRNFIPCISSSWYRVSLHLFVLLISSVRLLWNFLTTCMPVSCRILLSLYSFLVLYTILSLKKASQSFNCTKTNSFCFVYSQVKSQLLKSFLCAQSFLLQIIYRKLLA